MSLSSAVAAQFKLILRNKCMTASPWNAACVLHLSTAVLGYLLILVVALAHIPVLYKILKYKTDSALINPSSIGVLVLMSSNNVGYAVNNHLPLSTWGEGVLELVAYLIIMNIFFLHQGRHRQAVAFTLLYVTVMVGSLIPVVPPKVIVYLKFFNMPVDVLRKMVIMYRCHKQGEAVSPVSSRRAMLLLNFCAWGRLLTAFVHTQDTLLILGYGLESTSTLAMTTVAMVTVRRRKKNSEKAKEEEEDEELDSGLSSGPEDFGVFDSYPSKKRRRRYTTRSEEEEEEEEEGELSSETERYLCLDMRRRRRIRRKATSTDVQQKEEEEDGGMSSGLDESRGVEKTGDR